MTRIAKKYRLVQERFTHTTTLSLVANTSTGPVPVINNGYSSGPNTNQYAPQLTQLDKTLGSLEILKRQIGAYSQSILTSHSSHWSIYNQGSRFLENYTDWLTLEELLEELEMAGSIDLKTKIIQLEV